MTPAQNAAIKPARIWLHEDHDGGTTWCDDPNPSGDPDEAAHAVEYVRADLVAPALATSEGQEVALTIGRAIEEAWNGSGSNGQRNNLPPITLTDHECRHIGAAAFAATPHAALARAGGDGWETTWEVWEDDLMVVSADSEKEAHHYLAVYSQDGPVRLVMAETRRTEIVAAPDAEGR